MALYLADYQRYRIGRKCRAERKVKAVYRPHHSDRTYLTQVVVVGTASAEAPRYPMYERQIFTHELLSCLDIPRLSSAEQLGVFLPSALR